MDGLDTNILARYYLDDHPEQSEIAHALIDGQGPYWIPVSVVLELSWLLESRYELPRENIVKVLKHLLKLESLVVENEDAVSAAVAAYARGIDIGDAIHLASAARCTRFLSFDTKFAARAKRLGLKPACGPPPG